MIPISDVASQLLAEQERADGYVEWGGGGGRKANLRRILHYCTCCVCLRDMDI